MRSYTPGKSRKMNKKIQQLVVFCAFLVLSSPLMKAQNGSYISAGSLLETVSVEVQDWKNGDGEIKVPLIAWGADMQTILANGNAAKTKEGSIFNQKGLSLELYREDIFSKQVEAYLSGDTPFLRGTLGMINMAAELANKDSRTELNVIYQLSWSAGGDALVVKSSIRKPIDLKGKTVAVQAYGPHVDYLTTVLATVGLKPSDITIKWVPDLLDLGDGSFSPAMAFQSDDEVDAAMVIIPDALALTSGGTVGTGAEGSVKGAEILLSTRTADKIISDVYAVRQDFLDQNPGVIEKFVSGLLEGEKQLVEYAQSKQQNWKNLVGASAGILLDDSNAVEDMSAMLSDANLAGLQGNMQFFANENFLRSFSNLNEEIQQAFINLKLMNNPLSLKGPSFKFDEIISGGENFDLAIEETQFDPEAVAVLISQKAQENTLEDGELFSFEIYFKPNQNEFKAENYKMEFDRVMQLVATYGGALLTIEGHSDPTNYLNLKGKNTLKSTLNKVKQTAKNLSYTRAAAVKESLIAYADQKGSPLDPNQFGLVGHGLMKPNNNHVSYDRGGDLTVSSKPVDEKEWNQTRRVVFRLIQVEAETTTFEPLF